MKLVQILLISLSEREVLKFLSITGEIGKGSVEIWNQLDLQ